MDILILYLFLDDANFKTGALALSQKVSEFYLTYTNHIDCIILLFVYKQKANPFTTDF